MCVQLQKVQQCACSAFGHPSYNAVWQDLLRNISSVPNSSTVSCFQSADQAGTRLGTRIEPCRRYSPNTISEITPALTLRCSSFLIFIRLSGRNVNSKRGNFLKGQ